MTRSESENYRGSCAGIREQVFEFLDAELVSPARERIEAHLSACPRCAGFFAHQRAFLEVIERRGTIDQAPAELRDRIRAVLARRAEMRRQS